jgi:DNA-directed RNA polymerase specialized sigma subunit
MRCYWDSCVYCSAFSEPLNIDDVVDPPAADSTDDGQQFEYPDPAWSVEEQLQATEVSGRVAGFIATLSSREQEIVHRVFWLGQTQVEVARAFGVSRVAICKSLKKITKLGCAELADLYDCALLH